VIAVPAGKLWGENSRGERRLYFGSGKKWEAPQGFVTGKRKGGLKTECRFASSKESEKNNEGARGKGQAKGKETPSQ